MKKKLLLFLFCMAALWGKSQESWKDSVKIKQKVTMAWYDDNVIYFGTKKGMGIYDRDQKKVLVEPIYQYVKMMGAGLNPGYFFVKDNKVGFMDLGLQVKEQAAYSRLGFTSRNELVQVIKNDLVTRPEDSSNWGRYAMLDKLSEYSVAVYDGKVFINQYYKTEPSPLLVVTPDGNVRDSIDANGNLLYLDPEPDNRSMVFDLVTHTWLVQKGEAAKVGYCNKQILIRKETNKENKLVHTYYAINTKEKNTVFLGNTIPFDKKNIKRVLDDYHPAYLYCVDSTDLSAVFVFESGGKYGIYDPYAFKVLIEPIEYEFLYVPYGSSTVFTVKNGKVGLRDLFESNFVYDNQYDRLEVVDAVTPESRHTFVACNGTTVEPDKRADNILGYSDKDDLDWVLKNNHVREGLQVYKGKMVIHDFLPPYSFTNDEDPDFIEGRTDTYPGRCHSGVFDPASFKWTVPPKYSQVRAYETGYACEKLCEGNTAYSFFNKEGKPVFENKNIDSLKKDESALAKIMNAPRGRLKTKWLPALQYGQTSIVSTENKWGIFNLEKMEWRVEPIHQFIDHHAYTGYFTLADSGRIGILNSTYGILVPAIYKKIDLITYPEWYLCANDTFLYGSETYGLKGKADTLKNPEQYFKQQVWTNRYLWAEVVNNKLYTGEEMIEPEVAVYGEYGEVTDVVSIDSARTNITDLNNGNQLAINGGCNLREWDKGYITRDASGIVRHCDAGGKNLFQFEEKDSVGCNGNWVWYWKDDERYYYDPNWKLVKPTEVDLLYYGHNYRPAGYAYHYFDGKKYLEVPNGFTVMCANSSGLLLGYELVTDTRSKLTLKQYKYYDISTKQYSPTELELPDSPIKVYPVKDGFALLGYDPKEKWYTCTVLENDLKTVKSSFRKLSGYRAARPYATIQPVPYYELYSDKKIVYFDRNFQFLHECNYQDRPVLSLGFNRMVLKSKFKTIVMDWKGRLLRQ